MIEEAGVYKLSYDLGGFFPNWFRSSSRKYSKYFLRPGPTVDRQVSPAKGAIDKM